MKSQTQRLLIVIAITSLITALLTHYLCKKKDHSDIPDKDRSESICMDYENDAPPVLTTELVKSMVTQYRSTQLNNIQTATTDPVRVDAQAIWFDIETLKKFLYHVEHNVDKNYEASSHKKIGIRIYYAAYPKNDEMKRMSESQEDAHFSYNPNYERLHTLVMIPTISGEGGENYDFNPLDKNTYNGFVNMDEKDKFSFIKPSYSTLILGPGAETASNVSNTTNFTGSVNARNHGTLTPPDHTLGFGF